MWLVSLFIFLSLSTFWPYLFFMYFYCIFSCIFIMQILSKSKSLRRHFYMTENEIAPLQQDFPESIAYTTLLASLLLWCGFLLLQHSLFLPWKMYFSLWHQFSILPWEHEGRKYQVVFFPVTLLIPQEVITLELLLPYIKLCGGE